MIDQQRAHRTEQISDSLYRYAYTPWIEDFLKDGLVRGERGYISFSENPAKKEKVTGEETPLLQFDKSTLENIHDPQKIDYDSVAYEDRDLALYVTGFTEQEFFDLYETSWNDYWVYDELTKVVNKFEDEEEVVVNTDRKPLLYRDGLIQKICFPDRRDFEKVKCYIEEKNIPYSFDMDDCG